MQFPRFILGDNPDYPEAIFVIHTEFPRFIINLQDDEVEWLEDFDKKDEAKALYEEFPYLLLGSEGVVLSKRPDLILQDEDERWYIIDFKTDDFPRDAMQSHINRHRRQLMSYVRDMEKLTGIKYTPAVYFARHGEFSILVEGEADSPERPEYKQLNLFSK